MPPQVRVSCVAVLCVKADRYRPVIIFFQSSIIFFLCGIDSQISLSDDSRPDKNWNKQKIFFLLGPLTLAASYIVKVNCRPFSINMRVYIINDDSRQNTVWKCIKLHIF